MGNTGDKGTGKSEKITITLCEGRLTEEEIQKVIKDVDTFADKDKKVEDRGHAENAFDGSPHTMKSATEGYGENKGLSEKIEGQEKEKVLNAINEPWQSPTSRRGASARRRSFTSGQQLGLKLGTLSEIGSGRALRRRGMRRGGDGKRLRS